MSFDERKSLRLNLERDPDKYLFDLNKSNILFIKDQKILHPLNLIGKKIRFSKVKAYNPTIKKEVDSLRIISIN